MKLMKLVLVYMDPNDNLEISISDKIEQVIDKIVKARRGRKLVAYNYVPDDPSLGQYIDITEHCENAETSTLRLIYDTSGNFISIEYSSIFNDENCLELVLEQDGKEVRVPFCAYNMCPLADEQLTLVHDEEYSSIYEEVEVSRGTIASDIGNFKWAFPDNDVNFTMISMVKEELTEVMPYYYSEGLNLYSCDIGDGTIEI